MIKTESNLLANSREEGKSSSRPDVVLKSIIWTFKRFCEREMKNKYFIFDSLDSQNSDQYLGEIRQGCLEVVDKLLKHKGGLTEAYSVSRDDLASLIMSIIISRRVKITWSREVRLTKNAYFDVVLKYSKSNLSKILSKPLFHILFSGFIESGFM